MAPKGGINFDDLSVKDGGTWARYGQSKLANILHTKTLHKKYGPGSPSARDKRGEIWVSSVHPGLVETNLGAAVDESQGSMMSAFSLVRKLGMFWPADKGSWNSLFCAASQDMTAEQSGSYFEMYKRCAEPRWQSSAAKDEKLAERLEEWTREAMGKWM
ncbi:hypothetical protein RRF57_012061 [Xylaria bambusicola]|uniref:Uncharacterized protein n=1 Tax=Xylaria bambusicola TaxID=326684 RepID=A0AAN7V587_9PEZI